MSPWGLAIAAVLYGFTSLYNIGFVAWDDYHHVVAEFIPVPAKTPETIIANAWIRSPLPVLYLHGLARAAYALGITSPVGQLRFTLLCLAVLSFAALAYFSRWFFEKTGEGDRKPLIASALLLFYFLNPFFFTRAMYESLAMPFLLASAAFATGYYRREKLTDLTLALAALMAASMLRFQAGVCWLAIAAVVALRRKPAHLLWLGGVSALGFGLTGWLDGYVRGGIFHESLRQYLAFNGAVGVGAFRSGPFYQYLLLFVALSIPPVFFSRYRNLDWKKAYGPILPALLYFGVFVLAHSVIARKDERFMIPAIPLFLLLLVPLADYLIPKTRPWGWRATTFAAANALLLVLVTTSIPQNAALQAAIFLDGRTELSRVRLVGNVMSLFPNAFISHPLAFERVEPTSSEVAFPRECSAAVALPSQGGPLAQGPGPAYVKLATFHPGWIERILIRLNPRQNGVRQSLTLYGPANCEFLPGQEPEERWNRED